LVALARLSLLSGCATATPFDTCIREQLKNRPEGSKAMPSDWEYCAYQTSEMAGESMS
jgi:hypothetical protein